MSYNYTVERGKLFSEDGVRLLLGIYREAVKLIKLTGAVQSGKLVVGNGDSWRMLAAMDYLCELGIMFEIDYGKCAGQHRIFVAGSKFPGAE